MQVVVADDEAKVRSALRLLLEQELELAVVGEASNAAELVERTPMGLDLLLLDWELPGLSVEQVVTLGSQCPELKIVALSGRPDSQRAALTAGVDGFVSKVSSPELLLDTIRRLLVAASNGNGSQPSQRGLPNEQRGV